MGNASDDPGVATPHPTPRYGRPTRLGAPTEDFTIGVEEEYQIVHPETRELRQRASRIMPEAKDRVGDEVTNELYLSQLEIGTPPCRTLGEVRAELVRLRRA